MEAFVLDTSRLVSDVIAYVAELKSTFQSTGNQINDDDTTLQKFCVKFETILRHEQRERYSLLGYRKDYWNFIVECIPKDDGVKYVQAVPQMKTAQGKGRCFIRYALVQKTLADAIQRLLVNKNILSSWYKSDAIFRNPSLSTALVNKLYDLNDVDFDLPCAGYDLDISWPAFSRRKMRDGNTSGRRNSVSSMTSVDFRNERQDPLVGLANEIASLEEFFNKGFSELNAGKNDTFDVSISASNVDSPPISELTLKISHIHQQALKWLSTVNSDKAVAVHELKKAQEDKQFAIKESELKTKQMIEKFSNLAKVSTEQSEKKCSELAEKLSEAEKALQERESELKQLRNEVNKSVVDSSTAQKSAIELERQLTISERKRSELETEMENLKQKLQAKEQIEIEFDFKEKQLKERMGMLEAKDVEYKENISELQGSLRAKEVALQSIQESFEKLNGMVFGSFEELEADMKQRLVEKEKGLQNQTVENRKLELSVEELQQQIREKRTKLSQTKSELEDLQMSYKEIQSSNEKMKELLKVRDGQLQECEVFMKELGAVLMAEGKTDVEVVDGNISTANKQAYLIERCRGLFEEVQSLQVEMTNLSKMLKEAEERYEQKVQELQERNDQLESMQTTNNLMSEEMNVLKANKEDLEMEKVVIEEELKTALSSLDDMQSELLHARQSNTEQENELNDVRNDYSKKTQLAQEYEQQINSLKNECQDLKNMNETIQLEISRAREKVELFKSEHGGLEVELDALKEVLRTQTEEKISLEDELSVAKQQLESANEGRIRAEHAQVKAQEELQNLQCMMDQEVAALKFQLSSETMKYETEIKVLSEQSQESARYKDRSLEQEETITDLETKLKEKVDEWQNEKRKYVNEIKHLRHEVQLLKNALDGNKQKITTLENDLLLTTKQLDEERARQKDMKRKVAEVNEQKTKSEEELKEQMKDMENDIQELKTKIVTLTREKADFWKKAVDLEHELNLKASDRWVEDSEVKQCTNCKTEFSFLVRKHHCRLCGRIFCHSCVNNWVKTAHSSKVKRVCDYCLANDKQLKPQKGLTQRRGTDAEEDFDETMSDISIGASPATKGTRRSTFQSVSDEDIATSPQTNKEENSSSAKPRAASSPIKDDKMAPSDGSKPAENNSTQGSTSNEYSRLANTSPSSRERVTSPVGEGFEVINPHEEISEVLESRVVISDTDHKEGLVIPAVNDEQGVSMEFTVSAGTRYVLPVMVATPGAILCWSFRTIYKSVIFGLAYKDNEKQADKNIETLYPLARYSSNVTPVEGEWKTACHGVYLLVFDNTFSRFTSKQLTCHVYVKRKPSLVHRSC